MISSQNASWEFWSHCPCSWMGALPTMQRGAAGAAGGGCPASAPSERSSCTRSPLPTEQGHLLVLVAGRGISLAVFRSLCHHPAPGLLPTMGKAPLWKRLCCAFACSVLPCLGPLWSLGDVCLTGLSPARRGAGGWRHPSCLRTHPALKMEPR